MIATIIILALALAIIIFINAWQLKRLDKEKAILGRILGKDKNGDPIETQKELITLPALEQYGFTTATTKTGGKHAVHGQHRIYIDKFDDRWAVRINDSIEYWRDHFKYMEDLLDFCWRHDIELIDRGKEDQA